jgi:hypothetical protein
VKRLMAALLMSSLLAVMLSGVVAAGKYVDYGWGPGPNQGEASKVVKVLGPYSIKCTPVPGVKQEGDFGKIVMIEPKAYLYGVTVKSGKDATFELVDKGCGKYEIRGTKDISNFVVWTCPWFPNGNG